jgi:X-Pro dipeptidyl-peptidase
VHASVLAVHGLKDWNVKLRQFGRFWDGLQARGVPRKLWLHREAHTDPVRLRPDEWKATMHHWMDHWLYGIENGVMSEPMTTIERPDGSWETHGSWPEAGTEDRAFYPSQTGSLLLAPPATGSSASQSFVDDPHQTENDLASDLETNKPFRLVYLTDPLPNALRISGTPRLHVTAQIDAPSSPLTALLMDHGPASVQQPENLSIEELMGTPCSLQDLSARTGCAAPRIAPFDPIAQQIVTRGGIDVKNRLSIAQSKPLTPGETYEVDWDLHPTDYVFPAGHRIAVVISANKSTYLAVDPLAHSVSVALERTSLVLPVTPQRQP